MSDSIDIVVKEDNDNITISVNDGHFIPSTLLNDYGFVDNSISWNSAFSWGDHALEGYLLSVDISDINATGTTDNTTFLRGDGQWTTIPAGVSELSDLSDINTSTPTNRNVLVADGVDWESRPLTEADISDLQSYLIAETNDLSSIVTWDIVPDAFISESSVTQHEAALTITESQISDLAHTSPAGSNGEIQFNTGGSFDSSANFVWDNVNSRLGIGINTLSFSLNIEGSSSTNNSLIGLTRSGGNNVLQITSRLSSETLIKSDAELNIETDSTTGRITLGNVNGRRRLVIDDTSIGIGAGNTAPIGTLEVLHADSGGSTNMYITGGLSQSGKYLTLRNNSLTEISSLDENGSILLTGGIQSGLTTFSSTTTASDSLTYVFTGSSASQELDLPAGVTGRIYYIKNRGTVSFDIDPNGAEELYTITNISTLTVLPGEGYIIQWDGTYWIVIVS